MDITRNMMEAKKNKTLLEKIRDKDTIRPPLTREQGRQWMQEKCSWLNQMPPREFLDKTKEALAFLKRHNILSRRITEEPDKIKAAYRAILRMESVKEIYGDPDKEA